VPEIDARTEVPARAAQGPRERLAADRAAMNARQLSFGALGGIGVFGLYLAQNLLAPGLEKGQWQNNAYTLAFIAIIGLFIALFCFATFVARSASFRLRAIAYALILGSILGLSALITVLDLSLGTRDFISIFAVLLAVCVFVSAPPGFYLGMGACSASGFILGCAFIPGGSQTVYTVLTATVVVSVSVGLGAYLDRFRVKSLLAAYALEDMSLRDSLTCAYNRRFLDETLARLAALAGRYREELSLLILDIDHFKSVNDDFGHQAGDAVLRLVSASVHAALRSSDVFARYGGDEFAVILPKAKLEDALTVAEKLRSAVAGLSVPGITRALTLSVGAASLAKGEAMGAFVARADAALYQAKRSGRDRTCADGAPPGRNR